MLSLYEHVISELAVSFRRLENRAPKPRPVEIMSMIAYRYAEPSLEAALIQRLARLLSGLNAARVLLTAGYAQEAGAIQRMIYEFDEDIWFLSQPLLGGKRTALHDKFLDAFFLDDFPDPATPTLDSIPDRPQISRKKIRNAVLNNMSSVNDPSTRILESKIISNTYSGFVHGLSARTMEMYFGEPERFHVSGMPGSQAVGNQTRDFWNQIHHGCNAAALIAFAFGDREEAAALVALRERFEKESGGQPGFS